MTDRPPNPFEGRGAGIGRCEPGTEAARDQLQEHCDKLNRMNGDKYWFVTGQSPNRFVTCGPRGTAGDSLVCAQPSEVSDIMRKFGIR